MKKVLLLIILFFIPFIVLAKEDVEIKSIMLLEKSEEVTELENAKYEGLKLNFSLKFVNKDDYAKYKVILKNNSDKDYEIDNQTTFNDGDFIKYEYIINNDLKVLKANEELTMYIVITYYKSLDNSKYINGIYSENNNVSIELSNDVNEEVIDTGEKNVISFVTNPETSSNEMIILIIISTILCILIIILIKNTKIKMYMLTIVLLLTPIMVYGLEKIRIDVETYVEILKKETFTLRNKCYGHPVEEAGNWYEFTYDYYYGMTFDDFIESDLFNKHSEKEKNELLYSHEIRPYSTSDRIQYYNIDFANCYSAIDWPIGSGELYDEMRQRADEQLRICWDEYGNEDDKDISSEDYPIISNEYGIYFTNIYCLS